MKKTLLIIIFNILFLIVILSISEFVIYKEEAKKLCNTNNPNVTIPHFTHIALLPSYMENLKSHFKGGENFYYGRTPDGIEYKNKPPIILFGCSYAYGQYLGTNQTLSYKLAYKLKQTIHNRGIVGGGFQHMYYQATSDSLYETIPEFDTIIYVMIHDHLRRMFWNYFGVLDHHVLPHYNIKNNSKLIIDNYNNKFTTFFNSLYTVKTLNHIITDKYVYDEKNAEKITNIALLYFVESRKELEKKLNKKIKFCIIFYEDWPILYGSLLKEKLEKNGFIVTSTNELTDEDLANEKYLMQDNHHPTEAAWDLLTPKIIKKLKL